MKHSIEKNSEIPAKSRDQSRSMWFGPAILLGVFIIIFGTVLWLIEKNSARLRHAELVRSAEVVAESVRMRLQGNQDYLLLLAKEWGDGTLDADSFQIRASRYVADHPELINITWVTAGNIINDVAPIAANRQILGLSLNLPEPVRVSRLARERRQPIYTIPFEAIQGKPSFEIWVPVFRGNEFLGLFAGVYSCDKVLTHLVPSAAARQDHVSMVDGAGRIVAALPATGSLPAKAGHDVLLTSLESGESLRFRGYGRGVRDWQLLALELLCLALVLGMAFAMWKLKREIEERKQASEELSLTQFAVDKAPDAVFYIAPDAGILYANDKACSSLGYSREELLAMRVSDIDPLFPMERWEELRQELQAKGSSVFESVHRTRLGREFPVEINLRSLKFGGRSYSFAFVRDITQRKQVEEKIERARDFYYNLFEEFPLPTWRADSAGNHTYHNKTWLAFTGRTVEQEMGRGWAEGVHPDDLDGCLKAYGEAFASHAPLTMEYRLRRHDGEYRWILDCSSPYADLDRRFAGSIGTCYDFTERRKAEESLRLSEARFKAVFAESNIGIALLNGEGRIVESNRAMQEIFGFTAAEFQNDSLPQLIHDGFLPQYQEHFQKMLAGEIDKILPAEGRFIRKDGRIIWGRFVASAVHNQLGKFQFAIGMVEDITEQKKLEEQLLQAQKMESIGTLAGGVAHDFNNILSVIVGSGSLLLMKLDDRTATKKYVEQILNAAQRATALTQSLLAFSRKREIDLKPTDINTVIEKIEEFLLRIIGEDIKLHVTIADELLNILADKGQMEQVIMNLVTNARDAMPEGGVISISTCSVMVDHHLAEAHGCRKGKYALVAVADTGSGMDAETLKRIFEPFFTSKEAGKGTGLGLSVAYGIVKQHNGFITVYSEPDTGTAFRIYLPIIQEEEQPVQENELNLAGGSETILLAEDDKDVREVGVSMLETFGYSVITAVDGEDAIIRFKENIDRIDLVLLDVIMPKKNGKQVLEELNAIRPGVKVIFMSGYTADIISRKGIIEEQIDFITKPPSPQELFGKIREVLDRRDDR